MELTTRCYEFHMSFLCKKQYITVIKPEDELASKDQKIRHGKEHNSEGSLLLTKANYRSKKF